MKCKLAQYQLMLDQAGEQPAWQRRRLERHLSRCAACRAWSAEWQALTLATRAATPPLTAATRQRILDAGRHALAEQGVPVQAEGANAHLSPSSGRASRFRRLDLPAFTYWRPALAAAAVLLLLVGGFRLSTRPPAGGIVNWLTGSHRNTAWEEGVDQQLEQMGETLAGISRDILVIRNVTPDEPLPVWKDQPELEMEEQVI